MSTTSSSDSDLATGPPSAIVQILWSGGWDSTFRVLDLVLNHKAIVQPHYILSYERLSTRNEIEAMTKIRAGLDNFDPGARQRLLPLKITLLEDIEPNDIVESEFRALRQIRPVHTQYDWLNRYVVQYGLHGIEIGFERVDGPDFMTLADVVPTLAANGTPSWRLPENHQRVDLVPFERFSFPILGIAKTEMREIARKSEFGGLMDMTWFCHMPAGNAPCGCCLICRSTMRGGMTHRFPMASRIRNRFWRIAYPLHVLRVRPDVMLSKFGTLHHG